MNQHLSIRKGMPACSTVVSIGATAVGLSCRHNCLYTVVLSTFVAISTDLPAVGLEWFSFDRQEFSLALDLM